VHEHGVITTLAPLRCKEHASVELAQILKTVAQSINCPRFIRLLKFIGFKQLIASTRVLASHKGECCELVPPSTELLVKFLVEVAAGLETSERHAKHVEIH